jgi:uncharacterized short protein YbdD (DUF466 family)
MEEIRYQRNKLKMNLRRLQERSQQNNLLTSVIQDYQTYEKHMKDQDENHYRQLLMIQTYLEEIMETNQLTESGLNQLDYEHNRILQKLGQAKETSDASCA